MSQSPKLLIALGVIALILIIGFFHAGSGSHPSNNSNTPTQSHKTFDIASGDTNNEVLKSIVARQQSEDQTEKKLIDENKKLESENNTLKEKGIDDLKQYVETQVNAAKIDLSSKIQAVSESTSQNKKPNDKLEYAVNTDQNTVHVITTISDLSQISDNNINTDLNKNTQLKNNINENTSPLPSDQHNSTLRGNITSYYTIPDGATVGNVILLSPLVGEVPVSGQLLSPAFPFKALISYQDTKEMFAANSIPLPRNISGTILQGYSVGDMSLGCTRNYVMKILFVFKDGHYVVFPKDSDSQNNNSATQVYPANSIGYLSDPYNNPCISGKYITDAPKVIASLAVFGAASGAGAAIAQAQMQTYTSMSQGTSGSIVNGNLAKYAGGGALNDGSKAALAWYQARINNIFDVVFVPSTSKGMPRQLIFNITQTIPIDLNHNKRTLNHENNNAKHYFDTTLQ